MSRRTYFSTSVARDGWRCRAAPVCVPMRPIDPPAGGGGSWAAIADELIIDWNANAYRQKANGRRRDR